MKKLFFTLVLAIVSSGLLMANETICVPESPSALYQEFLSVSGTIQALPYPCIEGEDCPDCLAWAVATEDKTYYITTRNNSVRNFLEQIYDKAIPAIYPIPLRATASGTPIYAGEDNFYHSEYNFICVNSADYLTVEYFGSPTDRIPSLCDEWHMLSEPFECGLPACDLKTTIFQAATDTIINHVFYRKLEYTDESPLFGTRVIYKGALREGDNADIYYIPANSEHEYLMYAFNAQVGDTLENLWIGGVPEECPNGYVGVVTGISDGEQPEYTILGVENERGEITWGREWVKGVGFKDNPTGPLFYLNAAVDYGVETILCAYKDGQQVYASSKSEKFGCTFNGLEPTKPYFLCDEWNVLEEENVTCGGCEVYQTHKVRLTGDTILTLPGGDFPRGVKVEQDGQYLGTMRAGNKHDVYYIPAGSTHEYLLYNFDVKVGYVLYNLWIGGNPAECPNGWKMTVEAIENTNPRTFVLTGSITREDGLEYNPYVYWIEGVGMIDGPVGTSRCVGCADSRAFQVLCAYKNHEQIYTSELGEKYGCYYTSDTTRTDTIPMFIKDGPGTSTVEPVDPNQIIVTLNGDKLTIQEYLGIEIGYVLTKAPSGNNMPARGKEMADDTFSESVSIQLTESGLYTLTLTSPDWDYSIVGTFEYDAPQGVEIVETSVPTAQKILRDGQLLIQKGDRIYTVQGIEIRE